MSLSRVPMPSIALVLTSNRPPLPSRPSVIKFEFDPFETIYPTSPGPGCMSDPIGVQLDSTVVQIEEYDKVPVVDEPFFCVANDSLTDVGHSDHGQQEGNKSDARTMFAEKMPTTSRGSRSKGLNGDVMSKGNFTALASIIRSLLRFKIKGSPMNNGVQVTKADVEE